MEDKVLPKIREDIQVYKEIVDGIVYNRFVDPLAMFPGDLILQMDITMIIPFFNGETNYSKLANNIELEELSNFYAALDALTKIFRERNYLVDEIYLEKKKDIDTFLAGEIRPPFEASISYPGDTEGFSKWGQKVINIYKTEPKTKNAKGILAPHLDFRFEGAVYNAYSAAYQSISESDADTFIIFGTSHYFDDLFSLTKKKYFTPLGTIETDFELQDELVKNYKGKGEIFNELAHYYDHTIEYQNSLLINSFDREIKILPILCGNITSYILEGTSPMILPDYKYFIYALKEAIEKLNRKVCVIASGDLAHIGPRYNTELTIDNAALIELERFDKELLKTVGLKNISRFENLLKDSGDKWSNCGAAPLYALMNSIDYTDYEVSYTAFNTMEDNESIVSFGSLSLF